MVDETAVLRDFVDRRPVNGILLMPVVGQSGTGKSHLVRWIREHLDKRKDRHIVYIEKTNTNLSGVVRALLSDLDGDGFDAIRDEVDKVVTDYDERRLPGELLTQLALSIQYADVDETKPNRRYRKALIGSGRLSALLLDNVMYSHLLSPNGVVARLAKEIQHGRSADEPDRRFGFEVSDFPTDLSNIENAGAAALGLIRQLQASDDLLGTAIELLNENLDQAVLRLANLTGGKLQRAMLDIRRQLHGKKEIVLLVEDFAVIQGVQRDLLEAITEVSVREGREEFAPIRTLMAVTRGYYTTLDDTITTRVSAGVPYIYDLDVSLGEGAAQVTADHLADFTGRYLNAARQGRDSLDKAKKTALGDVSRWVPNACDKCVFRSTCHEAFGATSDGHGLYPFNATALGRLVRSQSSPDVFNPRAVLGRVIRPILDEHYAQLGNGHFPPSSLAEEFPLNVTDRPLLPEVVSRLRASDPADFERRAILLQYWADAPTEPVNLDLGVHEAFQIPVITTFKAVAREARSTDDRHEDPAEPPNALPREVRLGLESLESWYGRNEMLGQDVARRLRNIISAAVQQRIAWNDHLMAPATADELKILVKDRNATGVRIEAAAGEEHLPAPGPATIQIARNDETAGMLRALLMHQHLGHWNFSGGAEQARRFFRLVDICSADIVAGVRTLRGADDHQILRQAVEASLLGGTVIGINGVRSREHADLLRALFDDGSAAPPPRDADERPRQWHSLAATIRKTRPSLITNLRAVGGAAQGTGHVQLIDIDRYLPHLRFEAGGWAHRNAPTPSLPGWLLDATKPLHDGLEPAIDAQLEQLREWMSVVFPAFGSSATALSVLDSITAALEEASHAGIFTGLRVVGSAEAAQEDLRAARRFAWSTVDDVVAAVERCGAASDGSHRLKEAALDRGPTYSAIKALARTTQMWIEASLARAKAVLSNTTQIDDDRPLSALLNDLDAEIQRVSGRPA